MTNHFVVECKCFLCAGVFALAAKTAIEIIEN